MSVTRSTGASRSSKPSVIAMAMISELIEQTGQPSSTTTMRLVRLRLSSTVALSSGRKRAKIDHLGVDALRHQLLRRFERDPDADRVTDDGHVLARADDPRLADRQHVIVELRHVEMLAVEQLVLEEHDRVVGADRGLEQALGVGRAVRADHDQARAHARTSCRNSGCAGRRRARRRRWARGTRSGSASARPTCNWSWPPN